MLQIFNHLFTYNNVKGTVDGHFNYDPNVVLLWVDAHADINTNKTSETGSVHGMPVALLVKELSDYWPYLPTMDWQVPKYKCFHFLIDFSHEMSTNTLFRFSARNLAYIGLRSVDKGERIIIDKFGIPAFGMEDIEQFV